MPQAKHVAARERVGKCATLHHCGGVGAIDSPNQNLQLAEHLARFHQENGGVLSGRLALLVSGAGGDAGTELFGATRRIRTQRKSLSKLHGHKYGHAEIMPPYLFLAGRVRSAELGLQVEGANLALAHNVGLGGACVVTLLERTA